MLHSNPVKSGPANPGGKAPPAPAFVFECAACQCIQVSGSPTLPEGWTTETIGDLTFAYCPSDSGDMPRAPTGERVQ